MAASTNERACWVARLVLLSCWAPALAGCAPAPPHVPPQAEARAAAYSAQAKRAFAAGEHARALRLATHALVVRIAACDGDCPEVARSFVQLGDLHCALGQQDWAVQSYRRALGILERAGDQGQSPEIRARIARCRARAPATTTPPRP